MADEPALQIFQADGSMPAKYVPRRPGHWFAEDKWPTPNVAPQVLRLGPGRLSDTAEKPELVLGPRQKVVWSEGDWVGFGVGWCQIDDVQQDTSASQVLEEANAETCTFGCAFNEAGNVGDDKALVLADANDAKIRVHGGERVIR